MVDIQTLRAIGLTENEVKVYLALFGLDEALASKIGDVVGLNRTHVYDVLDSLQEKGLISYVVKENRKYFKPAHPDKLIDYIHEKQSMLQHQESVVQKLIPDLLQLQKINNQEGIIEIYKGAEGYKTLYTQLLRDAQEYYVIGATGYFPDVLGYFFENCERRRVQKKIKAHILFNPFLKGESTRDKHYTVHRKYAEIRFLPDAFQSPVPIIVYNDVVFMMIWPLMQEICIRNTFVAQQYKNLFHTLWGISKA